MNSENEGLRQDVEYLKSKRVIKKDAEIASKTGFSKSVISNYLNGRIRASKPFVEKFYEVFKKELAENKVSTISDEKPSRSRPIPLFEIDVSASNIDMFNDNQEFPSLSLQVPGFEDCDIAMPLYGHSMYPTYASGIIIMCKKIRDKGIIQYGEPYLIITKEQKMVKRLQKGDKKEFLIAVSDNDSLDHEGRRKFESFPIHKDKIMFLYIIKGSIRRDQI